MKEKEPDKNKLEVLKKHGSVNPHPGWVKDLLFEEEFFDPYDLVQTKYEMLRRVQKNGQSVTHVSANFGFSRLSFYRIQSAFEEGGLVGIIPRRRGPKQGHKLSNEVMQFIEKSIEKDKSLRARRLKDFVKERFGITIHPRSIERALSRRKKTTEETEMNIYNSKDNFVALYEKLRTQALNGIARDAQYGLGLNLFIQRGMVVWMKSWCGRKPKATITETDQLNNTEQLYPLSLHSEIVTVLVNMTMCHQKGGFYARRP